MDKENKSIEEIRMAYKGSNKESKDALSKKYQEDSKAQFKRILTKKMQTTFIGALSEFEKNFGFLWGDTNYNSNSVLAKQLNDCLAKHGIDKEIWQELWNETRNFILDNGNHQLKSMFNELDTYTMHWDRYKMNLKVLPAGMTKEEFLKQERKNKGE